MESNRAQLNQRLITMNPQRPNSDKNNEETDKKHSTVNGTSFSCEILNIGFLLTPPPTRQHTPTNPLSSRVAVTKSYQHTIPSWVVVLLQVSITMPLYIFSFWLMVEGIKAGGDTLIATIDYLAFRP